MALFTPVPGEVLESATAVPEQRVAGEVIAAGQLVYIDEADSNRVKLALATDVLTANVRGISVNEVAQAGQRINIVQAGLVTVAASGLVLGKPYYLSGTLGGSMVDDYADLLAGMFPVFCGFAINPTQIEFNFVRAGVAIP